MEQAEGGEWYDAGVESGTTPGWRVVRHRGGKGRPSEQCLVMSCLQVCLSVCCWGRYDGGV